MTCGDGLTRVRLRANEVVAGARCSTFLPNIRPQDSRQSMSAQQINQFGGLRYAPRCLPEADSSSSPFRQCLSGRLCPLRTSEIRSLFDGTSHDAS
jgi:hypothetical protein